MGEAIHGFFFETHQAEGPILLVAEEGKIPQGSKGFEQKSLQRIFMDILGLCPLCAYEGASTASEAVCLGVPTVYLNSTGSSWLPNVSGVRNQASQNLP